METTIPITSLDIVLDTHKPKAKSNILSTIIVILTILTFLGVIVLLALLALDIFTIPYLTPFAHFLALLISPFVALLFPLFLGVFLKICQHRTWPKKRSWVLISGSWVLQHVQRAVTDLITLIGDRKGKGVGGLCGLHECEGKWVEWCLVCVVVGGQIVGFKWDAGYVDGWIKRIVEEDRRKQMVINEEARERGEVPAGSDLEKAEMSKGVGFKSAEEQEMALVFGEKLADKEALIFLGEKKA
ncbi:uncharacterized protein RAG0_15033 [Rhynchosporium agropyri]|uniref:Uncharacterized protein n=1 Tax=Rhynchosporium agropyri TaxID=914238 RepID=A0A1E1LJC3_9HELO|nr:uncharacterized protein RAG0_15033 [Rhynchosporium agropyri]